MMLLRYFHIMLNMSINKYQLLSQFHPGIKDLGGSHYWHLYPSMPKDLLIDRGSKNLKLAQTYKDMEYLEFLYSYLIKEGYECESELTDLESVINRKIKIKLQIKPKIKDSVQKEDLKLSSVSKRKKQHEKALLMQKEVSTKYERKRIHDLTQLKIIKDIAENQLDQILISEDSVNVANLRRAIIIYISSKNLQVGTKFKLDKQMQILLGNSDYCSYVDLRERLNHCLDIGAENILDNMKPIVSKLKMNVINRIPVKKKATFI